MSDGPDPFAPFSLRRERQVKEQRRRRSRGPVEQRRHRRRATWMAWLASFTVGLLMLGVLALHAFQGAMSCSQDTSYCADTRDESGLAVGGNQESEGQPIAWHEAYDLGASWQYRSVNVVGLLGLGLLVVAVVLPASFRRKVRNAGVVVCLTGIGLWIFVWSM